MKKFLLIVSAGVGVCFLVPILYTFGMMLYFEYHETKQMRHLRSEFERSDNVEKYSIGRIHEDKGWAKVWLKSGEYINFSLSQKNLRNEKWYVTQFGYYECEDGLFDVFSVAQNALNKPVRNVHEILDKSIHITERLEKMQIKQIGGCMLKITYDRFDPPEFNEWQVMWRG